MGPSSHSNSYWNLRRCIFSLSFDGPGKYGLLFSPPPPSRSFRGASFLPKFDKPSGPDGGFGRSYSSLFKATRLSVPFPPLRVLFPVMLGPPNTIQSPLSIFPLVRAPRATEIFRLSKGHEEDGDPHISALRIRKFVFFSLPFAAD